MEITGPVDLFLWALDKTWVFLVLGLIAGIAIYIGKEAQKEIQKKQELKDKMRNYYRR
jgi:hypothetical protein